jgi:hypothetical protein
MAASKDNRGTGGGTNPFFLTLFRDRSDSDEQERNWHLATVHAGEGDPPLRFPVYETLYLINVHAQKLIDLLDEVTSRFNINSESRDYHQSLVQLVRSAVSQSVTEHMNGVEVTDEWLFDRQRAREEDKLLDADDVYVSVRHREAQRVRHGLPPRIQFLDEAASGAETELENDD